jgi:hypothetical protein
VAEGFRAALSVAAIIALNEYRPNHAHRAAATGLPCLRDWIARSGAALAAGSTQLDPRPVPAIEAVSRVSRQFELIAGALERLPG